MREARPTARPGTGLVPVIQLASPGPVAVLIRGLQSNYSAPRAKVYESERLHPTCICNKPVYLGVQTLHCYP